MTPAEFASRRVAALTPKAPEATEPEEPKQEGGSEAEPSAEPKDSPANDFKEGGEKEEQGSEGSKDVLSKSVEDLTDEEIQELAQKGKSGLLKRIAELTAKRKLAEEKAAQLETALRNNQPQFKEEIKDNPFSKVESADELQAKWTEMGEVIEWAESLLDKHEHAGADEVIGVVDGKEVTKSQVKDYRKSAVKAKDKLIPAQLRTLQEKAQRQALKQQYQEQARKELDWMDKEDNDVRKNYETLLKSPVLDKIRKAAPEAEADLEYVLAHAANSMWGRRSIALDAPQKSPKLSPPSSPSVNAGATERKESTESKKAKETRQRFANNGSQSDYIAFRSAQLAQRKSLKV
jgi:hypothetical protein